MGGTPGFELRPEDQAAGGIPSDEAAAAVAVTAGVARMGVPGAG